MKGSSYEPLSESIPLGFHRFYVGHSTYADDCRYTQVTCQKIPAGHIFPQVTNRSRYELEMLQVPMGQTCMCHVAQVIIYFAPY